MPDKSRSLVTVEGIPFDRLSLDAAVRLVVDLIAAGCGAWVLTPNIHIMRRLRTESDLQRLVDAATLVLADGMPVIWASRLMGTPLPGRVAGSDLVGGLLHEAALRGLRVLLLGGAPGVAQRAERACLAAHPGLKIVGALTPSVDFDPRGLEAQELVAQVVRRCPDLVLVGLGFPKQELLIEHMKKAWPRGCYIGCGITLAFLSGDVLRAPVWVQRAGIEWLYRLRREPRRLARRYLWEDLPYACGVIIRATFAGYFD